MAERKGEPSPAGSGISELSCDDGALNPITQCASELSLCWPLASPSQPGPQDVLPPTLSAQPSLQAYRRAYQQENPTTGSVRMYKPMDK